MKTIRANPSTLFSLSAEQSRQALAGGDRLQVRTGTDEQVQCQDKMSCQILTCAFITHRSHASNASGSDSMNAARVSCVHRLAIQIFWFVHRGRN